MRNVKSQRLFYGLVHQNGFVYKTILLGAHPPKKKIELKTCDVGLMKMREGHIL